MKVAAEAVGAPFRPVRVTLDLTTPEDVHAVLLMRKYVRSMVSPLLTCSKHHEKFGRPALPTLAVQRILWQLGESVRTAA